MKTTTKNILTVSICLIVIGAVLTGIGIYLGGIPGISITRSGIRSITPKAETALLKKTQLDSFSEADIDISSTSADIHILPSDDDHCYLEYRLDKTYGTPTYQVSGDRLRVQQPYIGSGIFLGFSMSGSTDQYVNLYLPGKQLLNTLKLNNDNGDIIIDGNSIKHADITSGSGDIQLKNNSFGSLKLTINSGDLTLNDTKIGNLSLNNEDGDNTLKNLQCDTATADIDSGSFYLDAAKLKSLSCKSEDGDITLLLPESLKTYSFDVLTNDGDIHVPKNVSDGHYKDPEDDTQYYRTMGTSKNQIKIYSDSGDITIKEQ